MSFITFLNTHARYLSYLDCLNKNSVKETLLMRLYCLGYGNISLVIAQIEVNNIYDDKDCYIAILNFRNSITEVQCFVFILTWWFIKHTTSDLFLFLDWTFVVILKIDAQGEKAIFCILRINHTYKIGVIALTYVLV